MDADSFDDLTRGVAVRRSRRATFGALLAGVAAFIAGGPDLVQAKVDGVDLDAGKKGRRRNNRNKQNCRGDKRRCGGKCVDVDTNANNCGRCGLKCKTGEECRVGACKDTANPGPGGCQGNSCGANAFCLNGTCCPNNADVCEVGSTLVCCTGVCFSGGCCNDFICPAAGGQEFCCPLGRGCSNSGCCAEGQQSCGEACCRIGEVCRENQFCE